MIVTQDFFSWRLLIIRKINNKSIDDGNVVRLISAQRDLAEHRLASTAKPLSNRLINSLFLNKNRIGKNTFSRNRQISSTLTMGSISFCWPRSNRIKLVRLFWYSFINNVWILYLSKAPLFLCLPASASEWPFEPLLMRAKWWWARRYKKVSWWYAPWAGLRQQRDSV